jgi:hypothetical protein
MRVCNKAREKEKKCLVLLRNPFEVNYSTLNHARDFVDVYVYGK